MKSDCMGSERLLTKLLLQANYIFPACKLQYLVVGKLGFSSSNKYMSCNGEQHVTVYRPPDISWIVSLTFC